MPHYCYTVPGTKRTYTRFFHTSDIRPQYIYTQDGKRAYRDIMAEQRCSTGRARQWARGLASDALAVHPDQIPEARAYDKAHGVPTEYKADGRPIFTGRGHRKAYCKAHGVHDNDGGYGDA